ncbi:uncharacterized protein LOC120083145 [Benincasa hispida]|uniref:uncharacterized protein LOC120083145 n=1 Tax=Benincasa hispida TaxID=102211 RepID=UPI0019026B4F|nr:uncharacterized protein LOC120083145 [Benincasa hispida]
MESAKLVGTPLAPHFKLSVENSLQSTDEEHINHMKEVVKWILRYLCSLKEARVLYRQNESSNDEVNGYVDIDYAEDLDKRHSLSGCVFLWGLISWKASLQPIVTLSTIEAEFITLSEAVNEGSSYLKKVSSSQLNKQRGKGTLDAYKGGDCYRKN